MKKSFLIFGALAALFATNGYAAIKITPRLECKSPCSLREGPDGLRRCYMDSGINNNAYIECINQDTGLNADEDYRDQVHLNNSGDGSWSATNKEKKEVGNTQEKALIIVNCPYCSPNCHCVPVGQASDGTYNGTCVDGSGVQCVVPENYPWTQLWIDGWSFMAIENNNKTPTKIESTVQKRPVSARAAKVERNVKTATSTPINTEPETQDKVIFGVVDITCPEGCSVDCNPLGNGITCKCRNQNGELCEETVRTKENTIHK